MKQSVKTAFIKKLFGEHRSRAAESLQQMCISLYQLSGLKWLFCSPSDSIQIFSHCTADANPGFGVLVLSVCESFDGGFW